MANLFRLGVACVAVLFGTLGLPAYAVQEYSSNSPGCGNPSGSPLQDVQCGVGWKSSPSAICDVLVALGNANGINPANTAGWPWRFQYSPANTSGQRCDGFVNNGSPQTGNYTTSYYIMERTATVGTCTAPLVLVNGACVTALEKDCQTDSKTPHPNMEVDLGPYATRTAQPATTCDTRYPNGSDTQGCELTWVSDFVSGDYQKPPHAIAYGYGVPTGKTCFTPGGAADPKATLPEPADPKATANPCPTGQPGTVNGKTVCIPFSASPTPSETAAKVGSSTITNADGSTAKTDTTVKTTCDATTCTTLTSSSTTTFNGAGTPTGTTADPNKSVLSGKGEFCTANPSNANCVGSGNASKPGGGGGGQGGNGDGTPSAFGGACSAFSCDGDAVMCAIAKAASDVKCELDGSKATQEIAAYTAAAASPNSTGLTSSTVAISSASFDSTNALGTGASCISDIQTTVAGHSVTLPMSGVCGHLAMLGTIMLAVSWLAAAFIIGRT